MVLVITFAHSLLSKVMSTIFKTDFYMMSVCLAPFLLVSLNLSICKDIFCVSQTITHPNYECGLSIFDTSK